MPRWSWPAAALPLLKGGRKWLNPLQRRRDPTRAQPARSSMGDASAPTSLSSPLVMVASTASMASRSGACAPACLSADHYRLGRFRQRRARSPTTACLHCWAPAIDAGALGPDRSAVASATASHGTPSERTPPDPRGNAVGHGSWNLLAPAAPRVRPLADHLFAFSTLETRGALGADSPHSARLIMNCRCSTITCTESMSTRAFPA